MRKHDHLAAGAHFGQARGNSITVQVIKRGNRVDENDGMRFRALRSFNCSVLLFLRPILWDQCGGFSPWYFDECVLKPLITKIRMLSDDQLEAWQDRGVAVLSWAGRRCSQRALENAIWQVGNPSARVARKIAAYR